MCSLAQTRIMVSIQEPRLAKKLGRKIEVALHVFMRDNEYAVLTYEKMEFLGKLCSLTLWVVEKPGLITSSNSWEVLFFVLLLSQETFPFGLVQ